MQFDLHSEIQNAKPPESDPTLVIGASFVCKDMREVPSKTTVIEVDEDTGKILLEYSHGELEWVQPNVVQEALLERSEEIEANLHTFKKILDHQSRYQGRTEVQVQWDTDEVTWEPLALVRKDDPITTAKYAHCLLYTSPSPRDLSTSRMPSSA